MSTNIDLDRIRKALESIELFQGLYSSSPRAIEHAKSVVTALRDSSASQDKQNVSALYEHVATGIELYVGVKK